MACRCLFCGCVHTEASGETGAVRGVEYIHSTNAACTSSNGGAGRFEPGVDFLDDCVVLGV
jgi:hypothetical protein